MRHAADYGLDVMTGLGVHLALSSEQAARFMRSPAADDESLMALVDEIEAGPEGDGLDVEWTYDTGTSWDAIHRALTDGRLEFGDTALHKCILGSDNLLHGDDSLINFLSPHEVKEVAQSIQGIERDEFQQGYDRIDAESYDGARSPADFEQAWDYFTSLREFFARAAAADRAVIFTVDQ